MARKSGVMVNESAGSTNGNVEKRKLNTKLRRRTVAQERAPANRHHARTHKESGAARGLLLPAVSVTKVGNV